jgi:hypothetical protein
MPPAHAAIQHMACAAIQQVTDMVFLNDRAVKHSLMEIYNPIFDLPFQEFSFGFLKVFKQRAG